MEIIKKTDFQGLDSIFKVADRAPISGDTVIITCEGRLNGLLGSFVSFFPARCVMDQTAAIRVNMQDLVPQEKGSTKNYNLEIPVSAFKVLRCSREYMLAGSKVVRVESAENAHYFLPIKEFEGLTRGKAYEIVRRGLEGAHLYIKDEEKTYGPVHSYPPENYILFANESMARDELESLKNCAVDNQYVHDLIVKRLRTLEAILNNT